jgi:hypothetical protein
MLGRGSLIQLELNMAQDYLKEMSDWKELHDTIDY